MKWSYGGCLQLSPSKLDLLQDILTSVHDGLNTGFLTMSKSELADFNDLCDEVELSLKPLTPDNLPLLRRIK